MAKNILVISVDIRETRVALIEDGIIAELHLERRASNSASGSMGNVVLGKVTRVLPGLQAAFIDIGQERAAFLHVEDLIRPDDFDTYLAGGRKPREETRVEPTGDEELDAETEAEIETTGEVVGEAAAADANVAELPPSDREEAVSSDSSPTLSSEDVARASEDEGDEDLDDEDDDAVASDSDARAEASPESMPPAHASHDDAAFDMGDGEDDDEDDQRPTLAFIRGGESPASADASDDVARAEAARVPSAPPLPRYVEAGQDTEAAEAAPVSIHDAPTATGLDLVDFPDMPGFTVTEPGEPAPRAPALPRHAEGRGGGGGRRRGRGRGRDGRDGGREGGRGRGDRGREGGREGGRGRDGRRGGQGGRDGRSNVPNRISKSTPIREVVKEGQEIIVQVTKEPIGTKGARCSSHISLPGRYVVYLPTVDHIGISKRIGSEKERARLREAIEGMKPPSGGLIVRTVAEGLTKKQLKQDVGYLVRLWGEIAKKKEGARSPTTLMSELDLVLKTARDLFTDDVDEIVIDDRHQYERLCRFVEMFAPDRLKDIQLYSGEEPIFDAYGIEDEIARALSRKVPLPSGGYLIIDQAEALTAIDVNTGRFVGKGSKDMEETILKTNLEAVKEIAYQLRFRNIGGLIILDLIDMEKAANREKVRRALEDLLQKDKAKTTLNRISDLGLIEMTRKRTRESLGRLMHEPCFYCDGTGQLQSKQTVAYEILREIRRRRGDLPGYTVVVNAHPAVADELTGPEKIALQDAENKWMRKITVVAHKEYHLEQFDLVGK